MKLLIVAHYFPLQGPIVFKVQDLLRLLPPLGVDVTVISRLGLHDIFHVKDAERVGNTMIYRALSLDLRLAEAVIDVFQVISTFLLSIAVVLREKIDIVFISVPPGVPGIGAFLAGKILRRKLAFDVRDRWEDYAIYFSQYRLVRLTNRILKKLFDFFLREADLVDGVTLSLVEYLKARGASNVVYLPNGADVNLFHPVGEDQKQEMRSQLGLQDKDFVLVYVGGIGAYYRPDFVIESLFHTLNNDNTMRIKFLIIGSGEQAKVQELLALVKKLNLKDKVIFLGEQERSYVARVLPVCDIGVVPYDDNPLWTYPQPTKFFEYCASGLPVIATSAEDSDLTVLIKKYNVGYAVKPLQANEFMSAVKTLFALSKTEREEMEKRARKLVESYFDKKEITKKLVEALKKLEYD